MTTDQYKSDVQTLEMILEGDKEFLQAHYIRDLNHFHDAVTTLWGLDERYHSTVFISFMHYLTDNNAAVLKRLKLQTLCEREQLFRKAGEMEEKAGLCLDAIEEVKSLYKGGQEVGELIETTRKELVRISSTTRKITGNLSPYSKSGLNAVKKLAESLIATEYHHDKLTTILEKGKGIGARARKAAEGIERDMGQLADLAQGLFESINKIKSEKEKSIDELLLIKTITKVTNREALAFITFLHAEFTAFILDPRRRGNKEAAKELFSLQTKAPGLETVLEKIYEIHKPRKFTHQDATGDEYENFYHETTVYGPKHVKEFENSIKRKWDRYDIIDDSVKTLAGDYVKTNKEKGFDIDYIYMPEDCKLLFACKRRKAAALGPKVSKTVSISEFPAPESKETIQYTYELTFNAPPSTFQRCLQDKKVMADFLWNGGKGFEDSIKRAASSMHELTAGSLQSDTTLQEEECGGTDISFFESSLREALSTKPEKILERYDYLSPLEEWRIKVADTVMQDILSESVINKIIQGDAGARKMFFLDNPSRRAAIETTIRQVWKIDEEEKEDLTAVTKSLIGHLTRTRKMYSLRREFVDRSAFYHPLPFILYEKKAPKQFVDYAFNDLTLTEALKVYVKSFLRETKKFSGQRVELNRLLSGSVQDRMDYVWGDGGRYDDAIKNSLDKIRKKEIKKYLDDKVDEDDLFRDKIIIKYKLPKGMDESYVKDRLREFLLKDTEGFLSEYDFSDELPSWIEKRAGYFIESFPKVECVLKNLENLTMLADEFKTKDAKLNKKYEKHDEWYHDPLAFNGEDYADDGVEAKAKAQKEESAASDFMDLILKDGMKILHNFRYDSELKTYLDHSLEYRLKNELRNHIRIEHVKKEQDRFVQISGSEVEMEFRRLLRVWGEFPRYFSPHSKPYSYFAMLTILETTLYDGMNDKEIKKFLTTKDHRFISAYTKSYMRQQNGKECGTVDSDALKKSVEEYLEGSYAQLKVRSRELKERARIKMDKLIKAEMLSRDRRQLINKNGKKTKLSDIEQEILKRYHGIDNIGEEIDAEFKYLHDSASPLDYDDIRGGTDC